MIPSDIGAETLMKAVLQYDPYLEKQSKHWYTKVNRVRAMLPNMRNQPCVKSQALQRVPTISLIFTI